MSKFYQEFEDARATRQETLERVEDLDQAQSEYRPGSDRWSVGELLDHLLKSDAVILREIEVALHQKKSGMPFVYRGIADIDPWMPWVLQPILPFFEIPFGIANTLTPPSIARLFTANRRLKARAPKMLEPRFGRPIDTLREELSSTYVRFEEQQKENPEIDLRKLYYFNPLVGLAPLPGLYKFIAGHETRHQDQLQEILDSAAFPQAA